MSGLIKHSESAGAVNRLPLMRSHPTVAAPRDQRIAELEERIAELELAIEAERRESAQMVEAERHQSRQAIADARAAGRNEALVDDERRFGLLAQGVAGALTAWQDRLASIDGLAATLAAAALAKMFGESSDLPALTARTLSHHVERLDRHAVVSVGVSSIDFPDDALLTELASQAGLPSARIAAHQELPAGACRVTLRLGEVNLDPIAQWAVIDRALQDMGEAP